MDFFPEVLIFDWELLSDYLMVDLVLDDMLLVDLEFFKKKKQISVKKKTVFSVVVSFSEATLSFIVK